MLASIPINLSSQKWEDIELKIPSQIFDIQRDAIQIVIDYVVWDEIIINKNFETEINIAIVCFQDAVDTACDAVFALRNAYGYYTWFMEEHPEAPSKYSIYYASRYSSFFITDTALRLYSAAEHLANFISTFLEIDNSKLKKYNKKNTSKHVKIGKYMINDRPKHIITSKMKGLLDGDAWKTLMKYRNDWVHNCPPLIADTGIRYDRKRMIKKCGNKYTIPFMGHAKPEYTIASLLELSTEATEKFVIFVSDISDILFEHIKKLKKERDKRTP